MIEDEYAYVVGIDFGTTFSGCCYAFAKDKFEDFQDITAWPKQRNAAYPKTPTVLMYKKDSQQVGSWGDAARIQSERPHLQDHLLEKFKLYLDEESLATLPPLPNGLTPLQVISDYLRLLHRYISETMERGFAQNYNPDNFRYCLTVPATWSDRAKAFMREASIVAGLIDRYDPPERLMLISEPEAAALYCEKTVEQFKLTHGQRFMICDAGGGTVDLIVFEINEVRRDRSLKEVTKGSGDTVGSTFLDKNMEQLIRDRFQHFGHINRRSMDQMMTVFIERIKPQFDDDDEEHFIPIPFTLGYPNEDNEDAGIMDGTVIFTAEELKEKVFEPVVLKVLDLIKNQLDGSTDKQVDAIFMVGGFGKSIYLHRRVKETFVPRVKFVGIPPRAEMAVVRGAVYFGLKPRLVTQRVSRRTYGLNSQIPFDPLHDPSENYTLLGDTAYCKGRFSVYATKGQTINLDECVTKKYYVPYPHDNETDLYAYDGDGPPPRLISDPRVKLVARFPIKMPIFDDVNIGEQILMTINMFFGRTEIKLEVLIRDRGCIFTSRLDLMSADASIQNTPPDLPPPYSSPKLIAMSSPAPSPLSIGDVATSSSFASTLPTAEIVGSMKPDDVAGNDTVVTNKPDESEPTSPTITQRSGSGSNDSGRFLTTTTPSPSTPSMLLTNSYQPSESLSSKTIEPSSTPTSESPPSSRSTPSLSSSTFPAAFHGSSVSSAKTSLPSTPSSEPAPSRNTSSLSSSPALVAAFHGHGPPPSRELPAPPTIPESPESLSSSSATSPPPESSTSTTMSPPAPTTVEPSISTTIFPPALAASAVPARPLLSSSASNALSSTGRLSSEKELLAPPPQSSIIPITTADSLHDEKTLTEPHHHNHHNGSALTLPAMPQQSLSTTTMATNNTKKKSLKKFFGKLKLT